MLWLAYCLFYSQKKSLPAYIHSKQYFAYYVPAQQQPKYHHTDRQFTQLHLTPLKSHHRSLKHATRKLY